MLRRCRLRALRNVRAREDRVANAGTTSTTGASAIISASARARIRSCRSRIASCGSCAGSSRGNISSRSQRGAPLQEDCRSCRVDDLPFEFMLNALRLTDGVPAALFAERTGMPLSIAARPIAEATRKGLLDARSGSPQADAARAAFPERSAGAVPRRMAKRAPRAAQRPVAADVVAAPATVADR